MLQVLFYVIFLAGSALSSPQANHYVESVLNTALRSEIRAMRLDPADLSDFTIEFKTDVKVKGKGAFTKGQLTGLSEAKRITECQGPYYSSNAKSVNCSLSFSNLHIVYKGKLKYHNIPTAGFKGKASVENSVVFIEVTSQQSMPASLKNFLFQKIGKLNVRLTGLGPFNKYIKFLEDGFRSHLETEVYNALNQRFKFALSKAVSMVPIPN